jgi:hypothetical protein
MHKTENDIQVTPPSISEETLEEMKRFFLKTSIPRIISERQIRLDMCRERKE